MNTLFDDILFEQNADDIVTAYTDYGLQVTVNIKLSREQEKKFGQNIVYNVFGVKACVLDTSVNAISQNTTFIVTFQDRPGIVHKLPAMRAEIAEQARQYVRFVLSIPAQASLF